MLDMGIQSVKTFSATQARLLAEFLNSDCTGGVEFRAVPTGTVMDVSEKGNYMVAGYRKGEVVAFVHDYEGF